MTQTKVGWRAYTGSSISYLLPTLTSYTSPILDSSTSSVLAISLRCVNTSYTGPAIRVRRSSDNTEQNIGFSNGNLDTTSLLAFVGSGNGYVTTWYDQSGSGNNAVQATASRQPLIVVSGVVNTKNTRPAIKFNGNGVFLAVLGITTAIKSSFTVFNKDAATWGGPIGGQTIYPSPWKYRNNGESTIPYSNEKSGINGVGGSNNVGQGDPPFPSNIYLNNSKGSLTTGSSVISLPNSTGLNLLSYFVSGSQAGTKNIGIGVDPYSIQNWGLIGSISEILMYSDDIVSKVNEINANINNYYSIYSVDTNPLIGVAYSLRKLRSDYSGSAIRVRRSQDNTEQNIGFDINGNLDLNTLTTFTGYNNAFLYSEELDNAYWTKNGVSITANQGVAPDGTTTADLFQETAGSGIHYLYRSTGYNFGAGSSWNMSFYVKKASNNTATNNRIMMRQAKNDYSDGGSTAVFNLDTGQVVYTADGAVQGGTFGILGAAMTDEGNGWWRCSMYGKRQPSTWGGQNSDVTIAIGKVPSFDNWGNPIANAPGYPISWNGDTTGKYLIWGIQLTFKNGDEDFQNIKTYTKTTAYYPGSSYVTTWYDQSGNGRNLTQSAAANQPPIVDDCSIVKVNGKPALSFMFSGITRRWLSIAYGSFTMNTPLSIFFNAKINTLAEFDLLTGSESNKRFVLSPWFGNNYQLTHGLYDSANNWISGDIANTNNAIHFVYSGSSVPSVIGRNGTTYNKSISSTAWRGLSINTSTGGQFYATEFIFYSGDKTANRSAIETDMNTYYSVY